ncbi:contactin-associated protein-like 5, partial [Notothenia coriiceps]|uniref:Contactin-associated protein-like 5 n=1 Tax=Notothenia coriiceps TaxID=8208 RepID=A0A6I9NKG4_9TELE
MDVTRGRAGTSNTWTSAFRPRLKSISVRCGGRDSVPFQSSFGAEQGSALNDGQWHSVDLNSRRGRLSIIVDKEEGGSAHATHSFPVTVESHLFFGGCPPENDRQECRNPFNIFQGCMRLLTLDDQIVDLIMVQKKQLGIYSNLQIDMCGIID